MARRKQPSKRRIKARFHAGRVIREVDIINHSLTMWIRKHPHHASPVSNSVLKIFRGSNE